EEIISMKNSGVEITNDVREPLVSFMGDCIGDSLWEERHVWNSPVVVCECTFLDPGEMNMARKKGHSHIEHLLAVLGKIGSTMACETIILSHFSMKYSKSYILETLNKIIPQELREKVKIFL
ncbi:MAG: hypothetical protein LBC85_01680, partial [Fibromonadaceae bacterium]|nr:hypothetical protein [Fibromonadaceae bacterium]